MKQRLLARWFECLEARQLLDAGGYAALALAGNLPGQNLLSDPALANPWGLASGPATPLSVSDNLGSRATTYSGAAAGSPFVIGAGSVEVPLATGQVYNNTSDFIINRPPGTAVPTSSVPVAPAQFIYASLDGQIYASNSLTGDKAVAVVTRPPSATAVYSGPAFTGIAIDSTGTNTAAGANNYLYATDYLGGKIDVFDSTFKPFKPSGSFTDPNLPAGYFPFNIENIDGELYVTYAMQLRPPVVTPAGAPGGSTAAAADGSVGVSASDAPVLDAVRPLLPGGGIIDVYDANGNLLNRFASGSPLDGPWGMGLAPANFGQFSGDLLVGNYGDGQINAFDPTTGKSLGALTDAAGQPITVPGLWGLTFGNGTAGDTTALFYAAGPNFFGRPIPPGPQPLTSSNDSTTIAYPIPVPHGQLGEIVAPATPTLSAVPTTLTAREGVPFQAEVAAFGSTQPPSPQANALPDYSATIAWGDGAVSPATVQATGNGGFLVAGKHAYAEEGTQTYVVTISDKSGDTITAQGTVTIDGAPLLAVGVPVSVTTGTTVNGSTMAVFVDLGGAESHSDYSATIDWGDGTPPSPGMIGTATSNDTAAAAPLLSSAAGSANVSLSAAAALQKLIVTGDHSYAGNGSYWATITITDDGGSKVSVRSLVVVGGAATNVSFVEQAFRDILHRDGDPAGLTYWQTQLAKGLPPAQFAMDLTQSAEYFTNVIAPDYQKFLGRATDASGLSYWIGQMQQGLTDQQLAAAFVASPEFFANAGGTDTAFVDALYQALLNRPADSQGEGYWVAQLNGGTSRQSVALLFASSPEQVTNQVLDDYFNVLGRSPSPAEVAYWTNAIQNGATNEQVLAAFIASPEFSQELNP